ncbi:hypothetical protein FRC19_002932 [Serendipita sp. 401]|nr:hypothetical protein FRC19_002932 [Serendipita sp. 401]
MFHSLDTTAWLSVVSRRKLQQAAASPDRPRDADKLLRKVLLRNSISRVDLALAEAQATSSSSSTSPSILSHSSPSTLPSPQQQQVLPLHSTSGPESPVTLPRPEEDDFVFPDATSLTVSQSYSTEDAEAEARWLESLLEDLSDDEDEDHLSRAHDDSHAGDVTFSHEGEAEEEDEEADFDLDLLWSTNSEPQTLIVIPPRLRLCLHSKISHSKTFHRSIIRYRTKTTTICRRHLGWKKTWKMNPKQTLSNGPTRPVIVPLPLFSVVPSLLLLSIN